MAIAATCRDDPGELKLMTRLAKTTHVPVAGHDLLVSGNKVADKEEDGHDDVLSNGDDVGSSDL